MKDFIIICFLLVIFGCEAKKYSKEKANSFVNEIILNESSSLEQLENYVVINPSLREKKRKKLIEYMNFVISHFKSFIEKESLNYRIVTLEELKSETLLKKEYNLDYEDFGNVFYIVSGDEVVSHIIFNEDGKIISFFPGISQGSIDHSPIMLDTFNAFE